ncbi:MAG TPA: glycosyltransferase family 4 protein [Mycobacteriales bacterium]|nr:glycosyltransferase family 4 protein [Mycobacteriales bacterium]
MNVLVVTNLYPPHALGGYELSCRDVVERWRAAGWSVTVLTTTTRFAGVADDPAERDLRRQLKWYWHEHELQSPPPMRRLAVERHNRARIRAALREVQPDVVSVWAMGAMSLSLLAEVAAAVTPMVCVVEDDWLVYGPRLDAWRRGWAGRPRLLAALTTRLTGIATGPVSVPAGATVAFASRYLQDRAIRDAAVGFEHSAVVPLGVALDDFPPREPVSRGWGGRLVAVGRIEPRKGFDTAIRAVAALPDATLRIVGPADPRHLAELEQLAAELTLEDRVTFAARPRSELAEEYAAADALLFPSRWDEPFGIVPLEAMTQGTPVVATRRGGSAEFLVDEANCLAIEPDDPAALAAAVERLAHDAKLRLRLVRAGLATATELTVDRFADGLAALHDAAAGRRRATATRTVAGG